MVNNDLSRKTVHTHVDVAQVGRERQLQKSRLKAKYKAMHNFDALYSMVYEFDNLCGSEQEQVRKRWPGVSAEQPYLYVFKNGEVDRRIDYSGLQRRRCGRASRESLGCNAPRLGASPAGKWSSSSPPKSACSGVNFAVLASARARGVSGLGAANDGKQTV
jgi:hypothetical protein